MQEDIKSQIDRAQELLQELKNACMADLQKKDVSGKTKNLSQEVLTKVKHLLDQSIYKFYEKYYSSNLSELEKKSVKVYFPIVSKKEDLKSVFGRAKMNNIETSYEKFYKLIDSLQPYNHDYEWLKYLSKYASDRHIKLTPQIKTVTKKVTISCGDSSVSWGPGVKFRQDVSVMGVPIDKSTQVPIPNKVTEMKIENWVSFLFEGSNINVLWLCEKSVEDGEKIIKKILEFI
jgi:hypothetical protein